jgi:hypothetical protein
VDDDEVLLTKFMMCGGYIWNSGVGPARWFAIEPGCTENSQCHNDRGLTPADAVRKFIEEYGAPWEKSYVSYASTLTADGPMLNPMAKYK